MIPTRALTALVATALGLVLLLSFRTPEDQLAADAATAGAGGDPGATTASPLPVTGIAGVGAASPGAGTGTDQAAGPGGAGGPGAASTVTATGEAVRIRWGTVQVKVTVTDGVLTDVVAVQLPSSDPHTRQLAAAASGILRSEALAAQSAQVDLVSGATYTSLAYARSLQSALDAAGLAA